MVQFHSPNIPVYSNTTGSRFPTDPQAIRSILEQHILKPVLFKTEIEKTYENGGRIYIEFGPKNVLTGLVSSILAEQIHATVALNAVLKKAVSISCKTGWFNYAYWAWKSGFAQIRPDDLREVL